MRVHFGCCLPPLQFALDMVRALGSFLLSLLGWAGSGGGTRTQCASVHDRLYAMTALLHTQAPHLPLTTLPTPTTHYSPSPTTHYKPLTYHSLHTPHLPLTTAPHLPLTTHPSPTTHYTPLTYHSLQPHTYHSLQAPHLPLTTHPSPTTHYSPSPTTHYNPSRTTHYKPHSPDPPTTHRPHPPWPVPSSSRWADRSRSHTTSGMEWRQSGLYSS